jgi:hypothetical protein
MRLSKSGMLGRLRFGAGLVVWPDRTESRSYVMQYALVAEMTPPDKLRE